MCGIAGTFAFHGRVDAALLDRMRDCMAHRGPDGARSWVSPDGRVGIGFRRLAIIDLDPSADQPQSNEDDTAWVVLNGEIYNHRELRKELEATGRHTWKTDHSDTEVLLHAYEEWGIEFVQRLRGMFAIVLWDARRKELWLVRDRAGIKPLYYARVGDRIHFASEIKALLRDPAVPRRVNEEALFHYLSFLTTPAPMTLFEGVQKVAAATRVCISDNGEVEVERYWDAWDHARPDPALAEGAMPARLLDELRESVRLHKESDVPVGVFLSGGIDSSTNAALFAQDGSTRVKTFTIGYDRAYESYPDETVHARRAAEHVGAEHRELRLSQKDLVEFLPKMVWHQDEPIADPVCVPIYYVSKLARDHGVIVAQVGEGADELFWGYPHWKRLMRVQRTLSGAVGRAGARATLAALRVAGRSRTPHYAWLKEWTRRAARGEPVFWGGAEAFTQEEKERLLSPRLRKKFHGRTSWDPLRPIHERYLARAWERSDLHWMTYLDLNLRLPELLLMRVDKMAMAVSLEGRVPFLDHRVVEFALSLPTAAKTRDGRLKDLLKRAVRGLIPDELIDRPKQGFGVPLHEWYVEGLRERVRADLLRFCDETDLLDRDEVLRWLASGRADRVWYLLNLALWWREHIAQEPGEAPPAATAATVAVARAM